MYHIQWLFMIFDISTYDYLRGLWHFAQVYELSMKMEILQKTCDCPIVFPIPQIPEKHSYRGGNEVQNKCFLLPLDNSISSTIIFASNFLLIHLLDLNFGQCQSLKLFLPEEVIIFAQYTVSSLVYKQKFMVCIVGKFYVCQWLMHSNFVYIYIYLNVPAPLRYSLFVASQVTHSFALSPNTSFSVFSSIAQR